MQKNERQTTVKKSPCFSVNFDFIIFVDIDIISKSLNIINIWIIIYLSFVMVDVCFNFYLISCI
jgi:hypothetical protein